MMYVSRVTKHKNIAYSHESQRDANEKARKLDENGCVKCCNCTDCLNCKNCIECKNCIDCTACSHCIDCTNCNDVHYSVKCKNCTDVEELRNGVNRYGRL